ncbi:MAG TPA: helix-turn-helix domain-containing protein [Nevskiaceae bacterium]|nr:helix-turn-helix domain-containing protein [Nevskiaceae bacterium]
MRTVGEILKEARLAKKISLKQVETSTKIRHDFLQALEENNFQKLPSLVSTRGFLKNYAEFLTLSPAPILAIFRRDFPLRFGGEKKGRIIPQGMVEPINKPKFRWTPKLTLISFLILFFLGLAGWLGYQYFSLMKSPYLEIYAPKDGQQIKTEKIEVVGRTDADVLVTVNNHPVFLSKQGEFRYKLELFPGENTIVVEAKSKLGRKTQEQRTVFYY